MTRRAGHAPFMREAIALARGGRRRVEPNPMVGAVVVRDGCVIGRGFHADFGGPHAEVRALAEALERARGAEVYVTLEPCSTRGQTPPCVEALIRAGVARVHFAVLDPNPAHAGRAVALLEGAGIEVLSGLCADEAEGLLTDFRRFLALDRPWVVAKWASTLDGRIATRRGDSKWITGEEARRRVHAERARCRGVLVGVETVLLDDPSLTVRHVEGVSPLRIVVDPRRRMPANAAMLQDEGPPVLILTRESPPAAAGRGEASPEPGEREGREGAARDRRLRHLEVPDLESGGLDLGAALTRLRREHGVGRLLVEGGGRTLGAFFAQGLVDQVEVFIAPIVLGDAEARAPVVGPPVASIAEGLRLSEVEIERLDDDLLISGLVPRPSA